MLKHRGLSRAGLGTQAVDTWITLIKDGNETGEREGA